MDLTPKILNKKKKLQAPNKLKNHIDINDFKESQNQEEF